jgi:hypothetical protein
MLGNGSGKNVTAATNVLAKIEELDPSFSMMFMSYQGT